MLKETSIQRFIVEKTNKAEMRPEQQSKKSGDLSEEFVKQNTFERAIRTEIDKRTG